MLNYTGLKFGRPCGTALTDEIHPYHDFTSRVDHANFRTMNEPAILMISFMRVNFRVHKVAEQLGGALGKEK